MPTASSTTTANGSRFGVQLAWDAHGYEGLGRALVAAAAAVCSTGSWAQDREEADVARLERVVVTGTHIPQTDIEGALPVQVIRREEIERSGVTTVEQLLERVPANFNPVNAASTIGNGTNPGLSSANLRGLGGGSTLVLLNGRRLANYAFDGESVDLNSIPLAAIDRVEVLKDGASAIYGTDAIAGVVNFILRRDYAGAEISADIAATQHGGGNGGYVNAAFGTGDPARDGYNLFAALSYQKDQALKALDRDFARTGYRPELGINKLIPITFPANIIDFEGNKALNPTFANGCAPPSSLPIGSNADDPDHFFDLACGYDGATAIDLLPEVERASAMLRGTWRADASVDVFAEALLGRNRFDAQIAPFGTRAFTSFGDLLYSAGGPYYPAAFAAANKLSGDLPFSYRATELGPRFNSTTTDMQRYVLGAQGQAAGWDYDVAAVYSANSQQNDYSGSYVYLSKFVAALNTGLINPWGPSGPEGDALLASTAYSGTPQTAHGSTSLVNAFASRNITRLAAGPLALALGAEARRERLSYDWDPAVLTGDSPIDTAQQSASGSRNVLALFAELSVPIAAGLDAQLAARYDDYSDFGSTTNPKVALRWQPLRELLLRGSWGTGFRAPPLYTLYAPTSDDGLMGGVKDPIRCPVTGSMDDCRGIVQIYGGGNPDLQAETSTQWNLGLVLEPASGLSIGVDYWNIVQDGIISPLAPEDALRYPDEFADRIIRGPVDPAHPELPGPIVAIDGSQINHGTTKTSGIDVFFNWAAPVQDWGRLRVGLQGTYVRQWETQIDGVNYVSMLGSAVYGAPVPRWRSTLTFDWTRGPWGATLAQVYSSGYTDALPGGDAQPRQVSAWSSWDLQARYSGFDGWQLAAGIRNLFDTEPPLSNQDTSFQVGYNPQVAAPLGRAFYLRVGYAFK
jgi:iron complex outermembrane recepter protein